MNNLGMLHLIQSIWKGFSLLSLAASDGILLFDDRHNGSEMNALWTLHRQGRIEDWIKRRRFVTVGVNLAFSARRFVYRKLSKDFASNDSVDVEKRNPFNSNLFWAKSFCLGVFDKLAISQRSFPLQIESKGRQLQTAFARVAEFSLYIFFPFSRWKFIQKIFSSAIEKVSLDKPCTLLWKLCRFKSQLWRALERTKACWSQEFPPVVACER